MTTIWVQTQFAGLHYWPEAVKRVEYLKYPHRHIFHVRVEIEVTELNREIEFLQFKDELTKFCIGSFCDEITTYSCEQMCEYILKWLCLSAFKDITDFKDRVYSISVSEDGENGASWHRDKD